MEANSNRTYKDSVFSLYMSDTTRLVEVYNAIQGTNYPPNTPVEINTLDDVLYRERINDISFTLDGKYVILIEHQSTINENMPVRMLLYLGRLYEKMLDRRNLYRRRRIPLATPEFLVLYNGKEPYPYESTMRLSDAFISPPHENTAELVVKVLNMRYGENKPILQRSKSLHDYSLFIAKVQENQGKGMELSEAIRQAALYCETNDIMQPFLKKNVSEVENMLLTEWNWDDAMKVEREEGREEGRIEGRKENIKVMLKFIPVEQIAKEMNMTVDEINRIANS